MERNNLQDHVLISVEDDPQTDVFEICGGGRRSTLRQVTDQVTRQAVLLVAAGLPNTPPVNGDIVQVTVKTAPSRLVQVTQREEEAPEQCGRVVTKKRERETKLKENGGVTPRKKSRKEFENPLKEEEVVTGDGGPLQPINLEQVKNIVEDVEEEKVQGEAVKVEEIQGEEVNVGKVQVENEVKVEEILWEEVNVGKVQVENEVKMEEILGKEGNVGKVQVENEVKMEEILGEEGNVGKVQVENEVKIEIDPVTMKSYFIL